jgi:hypothetical protein
VTICVGLDDLDLRRRPLRGQQRAEGVGRVSALSFSWAIWKLLRRGEALVGFSLSFEPEARAALALQRLPAWLGWEDSNSEMSLRAKYKLCI